MDSNAFKKHKYIDKLIDVHNALVAGKLIQTTKFLVIYKLVEDIPAAQKFYCWLLQSTLDYLLLGQSLANRNIMDDKHKSQLLRRALTCANDYPNNNAISNAEILKEELWHKFPGNKRVSIHATRRRLDDPDLLLVESICCAIAPYVEWHSFSRYRVYRSMQYYCTDYQERKFIFTEKSIPRIAAIIRYFCKFYDYSPKGIKF